jgi:hypothetical protein
MRLICKKNSYYKLTNLPEKAQQLRVKFNRILKSVILGSIFDLYTFLSLCQENKVEIFRDTASGAMQPTSVQKRLMCLLFVRSVSIIGYFLLLS